MSFMVVQPGEGDIDEIVAPELAFSNGRFGKRDYLEPLGAANDGEWYNPCGGRGWRNVGRLIEIEGEGPSRYEPGSSQHQFLEQTWANWGPLLRAAARAYDVPVPWMAAIATIETGLWSNKPSRQASIVSPAGAIGVMQVMPSTARYLGFTPQEMTDPAKNTMAAAKLIAEKREKYGPHLPAIAASYNSGRLCSPGRNEWNLLADANYPRQSILYNNAAVEMGLGGPDWSKIAGVGLVVVALPVAYWISKGMPSWRSFLP